jgi:hypothetical protein
MIVKLFELLDRLEAGISLGVRLNHSSVSAKIGE